MSSTLGPLQEAAYPDCVVLPRTGGVTRDGYSYEQMEAERLRCYELGVAQERERAANLAESWPDYHATITSIGPRIACAIRQAP